jgi:hypothetical protein
MKFERFNQHGSSTAYVKLAGLLSRRKRIHAAQVKGQLASRTPEAAVLKSAKMLQRRKALAAWNLTNLPDWLDAQVRWRRIDENRSG